MGKGAIAPFFRYKNRGAERIPLKNSSDDELLLHRLAEEIGRCIEEGSTKFKPGFAIYNRDGTVFAFLNSDGKLETVPEDPKIH